MQQLPPLAALPPRALSCRPSRCTSSATMLCGWPTMSSNAMSSSATSWARAAAGVGVLAATAHAPQRQAKNPCPIRNRVQQQRQRSTARHSIQHLTRSPYIAAPLARTITATHPPLEVILHIATWHIARPPQPPVAAQHLLTAEAVAQQRPRCHDCQPMQKKGSLIKVEPTAAPHKLRSCSCTAQAVSGRADGRPGSQGCRPTN